jgi:hypothetical protein
MEETNPLIMIIFKAIIKILIAAMLFACWKGLLPDHFQQMQLACFVGFAWITYKELRGNNYLTMIFSLAGAILLNPLYPIGFNTSFQYGIYLTLAIGFVISPIVDLLKPPQNHELM